jgi:hypothetical protein
MQTKMQLTEGRALMWTSQTCNVGPAYLDEAPARRRGSLLGKQVVPQRFGGLRNPGRC